MGNGGSCRNGLCEQSQGLLRAGQSVPDGSKTDSLQDTAELGRGVCGVSGRIYVRHDKNTAQQGREQSGTINPSNTVLREGGGGVAPGAQAETTVEQIFTPQTMGNPTLEQVG